jgi:hypothetical protein
LVLGAALGDDHAALVHVGGLVGRLEEEQGGAVDVDAGDLAGLGEVVLEAPSASAGRRTMRVSLARPVAL